MKRTTFVSLVLICVMMLGMSACPQAVEERKAKLSDAWRAENPDHSADEPIPADVMKKLDETAKRQLDEESVSFLRPIGALFGSYGQLGAEIIGLGLTIWAFFRGKQYKEVAKVGAGIIEKAADGKLTPEEIKDAASKAHADAGVKVIAHKVVKAVT